MKDVKPCKNDPQITPELIKEHGLTDEEYKRVEEILGRKPTYTELGIFSVLWSEHCSYKSSRIHLGRLHTTGKQVIQGPGENAGIVDIGDGYAAVFKMESHNHPSYIEPYQGAATGVGGILRDVFTMGARPIANMDALRFGAPKHPKTKFLLNGVVAGIAGYGNCVGVPTVGGDTYFDSCYDGNILVNAFTVGIVHKDRIFRGYASGKGNPIIYVGSKTGRDGIHGATMASDEFSEETESKRPTVQVGDPFTEKLLIEACIELMSTDLIVGIQDMGAAGLTSSSFEMAGRAGSGFVMHLDKIPLREEGMTPYEIMLSESQERMLVVAKQGREQDVIDIFQKWDLDAVVIGEVTDTGIGEIYQNGNLVAAIPVAPLTESAPKYDRPIKEPEDRKTLANFDPETLDEPSDYSEVLAKMLQHPNLASKRWIYRQYDHMVQINTVLYPGGDAAVVRVKENGKALALSTDCNARFCYLNPKEGAKQAVAEAALNIACTGAVPLGSTDCLNFGNPEKPEVMWEFSQSIDGIAEACKALDTPIVSGNVSFYNDTEGKSIYPTPMIAMVGLLEDPKHAVGSHFVDENDVVIIVGDTKGELGGSEYLKQMFDKVAGKVPSVDLEYQSRLIKALVEAASKRLVKSAHDVSLGGLAVAIAESSLKDGNNLSAIGVEIDLTDYGKGLRPSALLFGEDQGRVILSAEPGKVHELKQLFESFNLPFYIVGTTGGDKIKIKPWIELDVSAIANGWRKTIFKLAQE